MVICNGDWTSLSCRAVPCDGGVGSRLASDRYGVEMVSLSLYHRPFPPRIWGPCCRTFPFVQRGHLLVSSLLPLSTSYCL